MKITKIILITMACLILAISSCSKSKNPTSPGISDSIGIVNSNEVSNRNVLAVYDAVIDPVAKTFVITPSERTADYHFPLTQLYPNILKITGYGWTPNFWADIKITHPFPGSGISAYDPRVIAILPANPGVSFNYPVFNCIGNNSVVMEPDGYTKLFDNLGGSIPGNTNPFKAYFQSNPYREWPSTDLTFDNQRWDMNLAGFGGPLKYKLVVDVSTNYPSPSQPIIDNAQEPVKIKFEIGNNLTPDGDSTQVKATFLDWQGSDEIKCKVECPQLFNGAIQLFYSEPGSNPDEYIFSGAISNELHAPLGEYDVLLSAWDIPTDAHIFIEGKAAVKNESGFDLWDVTPSGFDKILRDVYVAGDYAYVIYNNEIMYSGGLQIIDITTPESAHVIKSVSLDGDIMQVVATGGYAYVTSRFYGLQIIDVNPPATAYLVKTVDVPSWAFGVDISGDYAFVAGFSEGLLIMDISPPESAYIVKTVPTTGTAGSVCVSGDYAYLADDAAGFRIIDINPVSSAHIVNTLPTYNWYDIFVSNGYAYITQDGLGIIDVEPPEAAYFVNTVFVPEGAGSVHILNGYAFITSGEKGMQIIDIEPPESASVVDSIETPGLAQGIFVTNDYAYIADGVGGLRIIKLH